MVEAPASERLMKDIVLACVLSLEFVKSLKYEYIYNIYMTPRSKKLTHVYSCLRLEMWPPIRRSRIVLSELRHLDTLSSTSFERD